MQLCKNYLLQLISLLLKDKKIPNIYKGRVMFKKSTILGAINIHNNKRVHALHMHIIYVGHIY